jgi:hypothetical protein
MATLSEGATANFIHSVCAVLLSILLHIFSKMSVNNIYTFMRMNVITILELAMIVHTTVSYCD